MPPLTCINPTIFVIYSLSLGFLARLVSSHLVASNPITTINSNTTITTIIWSNDRLMLSSESFSKNSLVAGPAGVVIGQAHRLIHNHSRSGMKPSMTYLIKRKFKNTSQGNKMIAAANACSSSSIYQGVGGGVKSANGFSDSLSNWWHLCPVKASSPQGACIPVASSRPLRQRESLSKTVSSRPFHW